MIAGTLAAFLLFQAVALVVALRRLPSTPGISLKARIVWTLVPLATVGMVFGSLLVAGRISL
jgi:hypothetical protein